MIIICLSNRQKLEFLLASIFDARSNIMITNLKLLWTTTKNVIQLRCRNICMCKYFLLVCLNLDHLWKLRWWWITRGDFYMNVWKYFPKRRRNRTLVSYLNFQCCYHKYVMIRLTANKDDIMIKVSHSMGKTYIFELFDQGIFRLSSL